MQVITFISFHGRVVFNMLFNVQLGKNLYSLNGKTVQLKGALSNDQLMYCWVHTVDFRL